MSSSEDVDIGPTDADRRPAPSFGPGRGKTAIVTGGTSGIGREVTLALCGLGWRVLTLGRDRARSQQTVQDAGPTCEAGTLDMSRLADVREFGSRRRDQGAPLDLLVCNAGIMAPPNRQDGAEGLELQLTVNHLAHYVLATRLIPVLRAAATPRIVWVTSVRHRQAPYDEPEPWDPRPYDGRASYATSKAWNLAFALWLDNRLKRDQSGLRSVAAHPGWSHTALQRTGPLFDTGSARGRRQAWLTARLGQSAAKGAIPIIDAALQPLDDYPTHLGPSGLFELWGKGSTLALTSAMVADEEYQGWVAAKSAELTRTQLPT